ncbi:MAG: SDR family NAD(P)-dependent oxidoreductase [Acidimicrobiia bacterium]
MGTRMEGKVAVVTGAASGLGLVYAKAFVAEGAYVAINDLSTSAAAAALGARAIGVDGDVRDPDAMATLVDAAVRAFGGIDIVIANAGIDRLGYVHEMSYETWRSTVAVHIDGAFNVVHHAVPHLIARGGGTIVSSGSAGGFVPMARHLPYAAAKAALFGMNIVLATELAPYAINVNSIWPGLSRTHIVDDFADDALAAGIMDAAAVEAFKASAQPPENVVPLLLYLCSPAGRRITGRTLSIMHGHLAEMLPPAEGNHADAATERWTDEAMAEAMRLLFG